MQRYQQAAGNHSIVVAIKVKHGGQAYHFIDCDDVAFERVRWLGHSRGIFAGCSNVVLRDTRVERANRRLALATNGGGPQVNHCTNLTISNHTSENTGDDALGLFHVRGGSVTGCTIRDSFDTGIKLCDVDASVDVSGNLVERCPLFRTRPGSAAKSECMQG